MATPGVNRAINAGLRIDTDITIGMMPTLTFEPTVGIVAGKINKLGLDIRSFREPLERSIKQVMIPSFRTNFQRGGRPAWEPLSESTREIRSRRGGGNRLLSVSGSLQRVATQQNIWKVRQESAIIEGLPANVWYGRIHQAGYGGSGGGRSMAGRIKKFGSAKAALDSLLDEQYDVMKKGGTMAGGVAEIPQRRFIMMQPEDEDNISEVFVKWLEERVHASFGRGGRIR